MPIRSVLANIGPCQREPPVVDGWRDALPGVFVWAGGHPHEGRSCQSLHDGAPDERATTDGASLGATGPG